MADIVVDGFTRAYWVSAIANIAAPTTTELNAGLSLTATLTADGLQGFQPDTADVDNSSLASTFDTVTIGRDSFKNTALMLKKQTGTDTIYNTLTRGTAGYVVLRRDIDQATAWASTQAVEVYPVICGQTQRQDPAANEVTKYKVPTKITSTPNLRSAVA
jgi:hypothetical protein